ncbi:WhiB family transcriptional regulator [Nocardiopsis synnemataformans]|uniref:WhiB family transcriptional regulator n=1 Tax=Nocardiopsis synnemataformans TaxID=61305 RepID=UPI003EB77CC8
MILLREELPLLSEAACVGYPPEWWFSPSHHKETTWAKSICGGCPERLRCRDWAETHREQGVWGGVIRALGTEDDDPAPLPPLAEGEKRCDGCGKGVTRRRKGLCTPCYGRAYRSGQWDDPPPPGQARTERVESYKTLAARGLGTAEIALEIGVDVRTVREYAREVRDAASIPA